MMWLHVLPLWLCMFAISISGEEFCVKKPRFDKCLQSQLDRFLAVWIRPHKLEIFTSHQTRWLKSLDFKPLCKPSRIRKEYRQMNSDERKDFHDALKAMMTNLISGESEYHIFVRYHNPMNSPQAHGGAAFLPWHREYLFRLENALRKHKPKAFIPYWDSTLDRSLPTPADSVLWRDALLGDRSDDVTTGTFANWAVTSECNFGGAGKLRRDVGSSSDSLLFEDSDIDDALNLNTFEELHTSRFEGVHGGPHGWVGGQMGSIVCSPSDPIFWLHHAFIDCVWETFRQTSQTTLLTEYNDGPGIPSAHKPDTLMQPFEPMKNKRGVQEFYTKCFYTCAKRPHCCIKHSDCGNTRYLWCHRGRCKSKVNAGGDCTGLPDVACYFLHRCVNNKCKFAFFGHYRND